MNKVSEFMKNNWDFTGNVIEYIMWTFNEDNINRIKKTLKKEHLDNHDLIVFYVNYVKKTPEDEHKLQDTDFLKTFIDVFDDILKQTLIFKKVMKISNIELENSIKK